MRYNLFENQKDALILVARVLLMVLFVTFGWKKLSGFTSTVVYMTSVGAPVPTLSAIIAVLMELPVGIALIVGFYTRPFALLLALFTLGTALIGHSYWTMAGTEQYVNMIMFYKNVSIIGGLLLLTLTGPGKYSIDKR
ncbi:DoxX family protein [Burkholderia pyrrocinia]|uniref:DoxX family protein n=1 Tax=Burkholderia pyrrocinia TaxID=60550 RepID=A0ABZ3BVC8_BURPY